MISPCYSSRSGGAGCDIIALRLLPKRSYIGLRSIKEAERGLSYSKICVACNLTENLEFPGPVPARGPMVKVNQEL